MNKVNEKWLKTPETRLLISQTNRRRCTSVESFCTMIGLYCPPWFWPSQHTHTCGIASLLTLSWSWVGLVCFLMSHLCLFNTTNGNMKSLLCRIHCMCLLTCWLSRMLMDFWLKNKTQNNLSPPPPHCLHGERDKSAVPFNTKGRPSKTEEDSLTVWGRLVAHNRCYSLINNTVCQGWASHPFEADCIKFDTHKMNVLIAYEVMRQKL